MADTWGDIISRNYSAGRAIADDFVASRFAKKADQVRSKYEERAKTEGKQLQDFLPDLEAELRTLAADTGVTRRGVTDKKGQALDMGAMGRIREDVARGGEQRAGALAMAGDQAGARQTRAGAQYAIGEFDAGQGQQIAGDTIAATQGALGPDGKYNAQQGALGLAKVGAQYGNAEAAAGQAEQADTFRMKSAAAKATQLYQLISNPQSADNDQIRGLWEGIKQDVPEFKNVDLQLQGGKVYIYENGKATGDLDPQEAAQLLQVAIQAPGQAIQSSMQAQLKAIEDAKATRTGVDKTILEASTRVIEKLTAAGIPSTLSSAFVGAQKAVAASGGGFQLKEIGEEPGTYIVDNGGQKLVVKTNQPVAGALGAGGATDTVQVFDLNGNPVPPETLNKAGLGPGGEAAQAVIQLSMEQAKAGTKLNFEVLNQQLEALNNLGAAYGGSQKPITSAGGRGKKGELPPAGPVRNAIEAAAKKYGVPLEYAFALAQQESGYNPAATNSEFGATGLYQYIPGTAKEQGIDPTNPEQSADAAMRQFAERMKRGGVDEAIMAHFAGDGGGNRKEKTSAYLAEVQSRANDIREQLAGGAKPKGALPVSAPGTGKEAMLQNAVAQSAPAQQTKVPGGRRGAIDPKFVRKQGTDLMALRDTVIQKQEALKRFDEENGTRLEYVPGRGLDSAGTTKATNLPPNVAAVRDRLIADLAKYQQDMITMTAETRANAAALRKSEADSRDAKERDTLYARYGGSADFFSRAGSSAGSQ